MNIEVIKKEEIQGEQQYVCLHCSGDLTIHNMNFLKTQLEEILNYPHAKKIVIYDVHAIDVAFMQLLQAFQRSCGNNNTASLIEWQLDEIHKDLLIRNGYSVN